MLDIDGSYGEGGGQVLRYAVALSVYTKKPVEITNIRARRHKPGIRPQHLTAISCIASMCNAKTEGLSIGSSRLSFFPGNIKAGEYKFDVGTAGSITLIFQACIISALQTKKPIKINITGGTDVKWSPSWDYFKKIFLPLISSMGVKVEANLIKRGYYPKGGGKAEIKIHPINKIKSLTLDNNPAFKKIEGIINISNLPNNISIRMKHTIFKKSINNNFQTSIDIEESKSDSPGVGITLWSISNKAILGSSIIGEKGIPAEQIGDKSINQIINQINSKANIDFFAIDQILPYMMISDNPSKCRVSSLTNHASTSIWLLKKFFNKDILIKKNNNLIEIFT